MKENEVEEEIPEQKHESFVKSYGIYNNFLELSEEQISHGESEEPLRIKVNKLPPQTNLNEEDNRILRNTYDFLFNLIECRAKTHIEESINEKRIKPALVILWVFGMYGRLNDDNSEIIIFSEDVDDKTEFVNIVRKRDNSLQESATQAAILLDCFGIKVQHIQLPRRRWKLKLTSNDETTRDVLQGLKLISGKLIEKYGEPDYNGGWRYKGSAFKKFQRLDFNVFKE